MIKEINWIEYGKDFETFREEFKDNLVGMYVQYLGYPKGRNEPIEEALIGTVNENGGSCNCCPALMEESLILKYAKLIEVEVEV